MTAQLDTGLQSLLMMASLHGIPADEAKLRHEFGQTSGLFDTNTILLAAKQLGFTARAVLQKPERLDKAPLPAVARGNLFYIPPDRIQRHTPRILDGAERLCGQLEEARARR